MTFTTFIILLITFIIAGIILSIARCEEGWQAAMGGYTGVLKVSR